MRALVARQVAGCWAAGSWWERLIDLWPECGSEGEARSVRAWCEWCQDVVVTEPKTYPARLHRVGDHLQHWSRRGRRRQMDNDPNTAPPTYHHSP